MTSEEADQHRRARLTARSAKYTANIAQLRALCNETAATLCSHGVDRRSCSDHRQMPPSDQSNPEPKESTT